MGKSTTSRRGMGGFGSRSTQWLWIALFLLFGAGAAHAQGTWYISCGDAGQVPCSNDYKLWDIYYNQPGPVPGVPSYMNNSQCDLGLNVDSSGRCANLPGRNGGQRSIIGTFANSPWLTFAMKEQHFAIQADQNMNWITIFGTHNSYSNYQDGAFNVGPINFNVDQLYSITDQLDAGARVIRLDPVSYNVSHGIVGQYQDYELRMCHQSSSGVGTDAECDDTSYGRLFAYGVNEVRQWLAKHPGEVVVIRMYRVNDSDIDVIDRTLFDNTDQSILVPDTTSQDYHGFGPLWAPDVDGWPTLRQMRAIHKNLIIFSDKGTNLSFPWATAASKAGVLDDGYTDTSGFGNCLNQGGVDVRTRGLNEWAYIGEDRSGSNYLNAVQNKGKPGTGLMDAGAVKHATNCGFGIVAVDFLLAGQSAAAYRRTACLPGFWVGCFQYFDYTFPGTDTRREAAIWSWAEGDMGDKGPAYLKTDVLPVTDNAYGRWGSEADTTPLSFACAKGQDLRTFIYYSYVLLNPVNYEWVISPAAGPWSSGVEVCKALGAKFWAPQSAMENQNLIAAVQAQRPGGAVWLNYRVSDNLIVEPTTPGMVAGPAANSFTINVTHGDNTTNYDSLAFQYTGGNGGALNLTTGTLTPPLIEQVNLDTEQKTITLDGNPYVYTREPGSYDQNFTITQTIGSQVITQNFTVTVNVVPARTVHISVDSAPEGRTVYVDNVAYVTPHVFSWTGGSTHTLDASHPDPTGGVEQIFDSWAGGQPISFTYKVPEGDASLTANFKLFYYLALNAGSNGELDVSPPLGDGFYPAGTSVLVTAKAVTGYQLAAFSGALTGTTNPQTLIMSQPRYVVATFAPKSINVTVQSQPANGVIYVDNYAYIGTTKFTWLVGATHTLDASKTEDGGGTHQAFSSWSIAGQPATFTFTVPNGDTSITGNFNMSYLLTAIITGSGTMTESPSSADGYYAAGTKVAITATPAANYTFVGFGGALNGLANPQTLTMSGPLPVQAVFNPLAPNLTAQAQLIGGGSGSVQRVSLRFSNTGTAVARAVQIGSATVTVASGTGAVTVTTVLPLNFGNVAVGVVSAAQEMDLNWPTSATSVELFVTYTANGGAYQSSQRWSFFRQPGGTDN